MLAEKTRGIIAGRFTILTIGYSIYLNKSQTIGFVLTKLIGDDEIKPF